MGNAEVLMKNIAEVIESSNPSCGMKKECETKCGECGAARIKTLIKEDGYVKLNPDQRTPEVPEGEEGGSFYYLAAQADMLTAGWRKVELEASNGITTS